jgi:hypothetical protein
VSPFETGLPAQRIAGAHFSPGPISRPASNDPVVPAAAAHEAMSGLETSSVLIISPPVAEFSKEKHLK